MTIKGQPQQRLFFALWPPLAVAERILEVRRAFAMNGTPVARDKLHITLAFHGACCAAERDALIALAASVVGHPISLVFDRLDGFIKPQIICLGMSNLPQALLDLAVFLRGPDLDRRPFVPHITLQRKAAPITTCPVDPIAWRAREFALIESGGGGTARNYQTIARWVLTRKDGPHQVCPPQV